MFFSSGDERVEERERRGRRRLDWTGVHCRSRMRDWRVFAFVGFGGGED